MYHVSSWANLASCTSQDIFKLTSLHAPPDFLDLDDQLESIEHGYLESWSVRLANNVGLAQYGEHWIHSPWISCNPTSGNFFVDSVLGLVESWFVMINKWPPLPHRMLWFTGGASWWTAEEENDRISMKKTNYIKITLLSFLKVCLYGYYTNCQFYWISLFHQLNIVFCKISKNHFFKDCILNFTWSSLKLTSTLEIAVKYFFRKKYFLKYIIQCKHIDWNEIYVK